MNRITKLVASLTLAGAALGLSPSSGVADPGPGSGHGHDDDEVGSMVYIATNPSGPNGVEAFERNRMTGRLTRKDRYLTSGQGDASIGGAQSHALASDGQHLYVVNTGSDDISAFAIERDGSLRLLGRTASQGRRPVSLALHGNLLYVANEGNNPFVPPALPGSYSGFRIRHDGTLDPIPGSTVMLSAGDSPVEIMFNQNGSRVVAARIGTGIIDTFRVDGKGLLVKNAQLAGQPAIFGGAVSPTRSEQFFMTLAGPVAPAVTSYRLQDSGPAAVVSTDTSAALVDPCWAVASPDGKRLWSSSFIPRSLTLYTVDAAGRLSPRSANTPADSGAGSIDIALDPEGKFLYRLRALSVPIPGAPVVPQIETFKVTDADANGGLSLVQTLDLPADLSTASTTGVIAVDL